MIERFRRNSPETTPEIVEDQVSMLNRAQARRLAELCKDFDGTIRKYLGDEAADKYAHEQNEVASKAHSEPPDSLDGVRF